MARGFVIFLLFSILGIPKNAKIAQYYTIIFLQASKTLRSFEFLDIITYYTFSISSTNFRS